MKEKIKTICCILLLMAALPYIITVIWQGKGDGQFLPSDQVGEVAEEERQLLGIVAHEMPLSYEKEALKAQTILARTNLKLSQETGSEAPEGLTAQELENLQREKESAAQYQKLLSAISETRGQVLKSEGNLVAAGYFAVSADVQDLTSPDYLKVIFLEKEEFSRLFAEEIPELAGTDADTILQALSEARRDELGYVIEAVWGETIVPGERLRSIWQLNSACFYCKEVEGRIRIVTKGLGHGIGMSQFGANEMAKEGKSCQEILQYYFKNIEITD